MNLNKLCGITHVALIWYIRIFKAGRNEIGAFFSPLGTSWHYIPFHSILDKSERNFAAFITHVASIWCIWIIKDESLRFFQILYALLKMMNVSMMECWENEIWGFSNPLCAPENEIFQWWKVEKNEIWGFWKPL